MRRIFSVDRLEGDVAVCISDDGLKIDVEKDILGELQVHDVFSAETDGKMLMDIIPMPEERDRRLAANRERLQRLINRGKK
jgi:hypothetical protein